MTFERRPFLRFLDSPYGGFCSLNLVTSQLGCGEHFLFAHNRMGLES